ncbi:hypothetical protein TNCV_4936541 [Trichonephila clavipes]|nr:hypothetical protein TNCV_4936541 [Trichonephila clavipes]
MEKSCSDASREKRNAYHYAYGIDKSRIVAYWDCALDRIAVSMLLTSVEIQSLLAGNGIDSFRKVIQNEVLDSPITSSREDRQVTRMTIMDPAATSRALSQESGSFARNQISVRTVR